VKRLDLASVPDGPYELVVVARRGTDHTRATVAAVTVDNTPPLVRLLSPRPGSAVPPGPLTLRAAVLDRVSGVDPASVRFLVGPDEVPAVVAPDGSVRASVTLREGAPLDIALVAADRAGNARRDGGPVRIDPDAPRLSAVLLILPDGQTAAKPGDLVRIVAETGGDIGRAAVERSPLTGDAVVPLETAADEARGSFRIPAGAPEGAHELAITIADDAGNARRVVLPLGVDATPPRLEHTSARPGRTAADVDVCASEPVRVTLLATPEDGAPVRADGPALQRCHLLRLDRLTASQRYTLEVVATDAAGHRAKRALALASATDDIAPGTVVALGLESAAPGAVRLRWGAASDETGIALYRIFRQPPEGARELAGTTRETTFVDRAAAAGRTYLYSVEAVDGAGNAGPASPPVRVWTPARPELADGRVTPEQGDRRTPFTFEVRYVGPTVRDVLVEVLIDGVPHAMAAPKGATDCLAGCIYTYTTGLPAQMLGERGHTYAFRASVGGATVDWPGTPVPQRGPVVVASAPSSGAPAAIALAAGALFAGLAAAGGLFAWRRTGGRLP